MDIGCNSGSTHYKTLQQMSCLGMCRKAIKIMLSQRKGCPLNFNFEYMFQH